MSNIIIILIVLMLIKAVFCAGEVSFSYINKNEINQLAKKKNIKAQKIKKMLDNPNKFFSTLKISTTLLEYLISAFVLEVFLDKVKNFVSDINEEVIISDNLITIISIVIITFAFSYITIIISDLLPKKIAKAYPRKVTFIIVDILNFVSKIIYPFEILLNVTLKVLMKIFNLKNVKNEKMTEKELKMVIAEGKDHGLLNDDSKKMLLNTLKFKNYQIKDIVLPMEKVDLIDSNSSIDEIITNFRNYRYTRVPVFKDRVDNIIGILNVKDFIFYLDDDKKKNFDINKILRPAFFVSKDDKVEDVFKTMQLNSYSIAIVLKNERTAVGIVTLEDIIEKIVGDIFDEYDDKNK